MLLYTHRNGIGTKTARSSIITHLHYSLLFECCTKYFNNLGYMYPEKCNETNELIGLNTKAFEMRMHFIIPGLFRNIMGDLDIASFDFGGNIDEFKPYTILDLIEFIGGNIRDYKVISYHPYLMHEHVKYLESFECRDKFKGEINEIFDYSNLQYLMNGNHLVERILDFEIFGSYIEGETIKLEEEGIRNLITKANTLYRSATALNRIDAIEKIWDAFERIKSFHNHDNKNKSTELLIKKMSEGNKNISDLLESEFRSLTSIGNNFRIRHHEMNKYEISNTDQIDYLYNRILSLIILALKHI